MLNLSVFFKTLKLKIHSKKKRKSKPLRLFATAVFEDS